MNCREFEKHMGDFLDGDVDNELKHKMEAHLKGCGRCSRDYSEEMYMRDALKKDAASISLKDRQRRELKETILKAPLKGRGGFQGIMKSLVYIAAIYFSGGIYVNIGTASDLRIQEAQVQKLEAEKEGLMADIKRLQGEIKDLKAYIKDLESGKNHDWMMINAELGEAIIEGKILSVDVKNKTIKIEVYKDDNTPEIDPVIGIPDGIMISAVMGGIGEKQYIPRQGDIHELKAGDHITMHYLGLQKAARAIILYE